MMNRLIIIILMALSSQITIAQSFENFLEKVNANHPKLLALRQLLLSNKADSKIGLTPPNPFVSAGYFLGSDAAGNDKIEWSISQSIDFPSTYSRLKKLKKSNYELAKMEFALTNVKVLQDARSNVIEYISNKEQLQTLNTRLKLLSELEKATSLLLEKGETTIIDYNKKRIKKAELNSKIVSLNTDIEFQLTYLDYISNNESAMLENCTYPLFIEPNLVSLLNAIKQRHPAYLIPALRSNASHNGVKLAKSKKLPSFEVAYSSEIVGNEVFTGPSLGMSLPLWSNKGKVEKSKAQLNYYEKMANYELLLFESKLKADYNKYIAIKSNLKMVDKVLKENNNKILLGKSFTDGNIALKEYRYELEAIYNLEDLLLTLNKEKYILLSRLYEVDLLP